jgi:hypothetical protein
MSSSEKKMRSDEETNFVEGARQAKFVRHEDKHENVARFCGYYLDRLSIVEVPTPRQRSVSLLVRSPLSPAAQAVLAALPEFQALAVSMRIVFAKLEPADAMAPWVEAAVADASNELLQLRWARRAELIDGHEQLVMGTALSWAGDCMRREPEKRDSYEQFDTFDVAAAARAELSFASFWQKSENVATHAFRGMVSAPAAATLPSAVINPLGTPQTPPVGFSTRH